MTRTPVALRPWTEIVEISAASWELDSTNYSDAGVNMAAEEWIASNRTLVDEWVASALAAGEAR